MDNTLAFSSLRFGLGRFTTSEEIEYVGNRVQETVERVRSDENLLAVRA